MTGSSKVVVLGVCGDAAPADELGRADVVVGGRRLLDQVASLLAPGVRTLTIGADVTMVAGAVASARDAGQRVCVLASGDPGFFGMVRALASALGPDQLDVRPAPSSVAVAFARLGLPWDDAVVVSAHGRSLAAAAATVARCPKAAVLTSPDAPPQVLGQQLRHLGATHEHVAVCQSLGTGKEDVVRTDLRGLAGGGWDPLSVVVLYSGDGVAGDKSLAFGLPEDRFRHRRAMITKSEIRAAVLARLALPGPAQPDPVLWDVGAGSASVAIECLLLAPWLTVIAVESDAAAAQDCRDNARDAGVALRVVHGRAPGCLHDLPDPDRIFVGGGGLDVLDAALGRLRDGGVAVATYAAVDRAAAAADRLGHLTQLSASTGRRLPDGGWRLEAANPVFVAWSDPAPTSRA